MFLVGLPPFYFAWAIVGYLYIVPYAETIPYGMPHAEVDAHMVGCYSQKVDDITKEPCAYCGSSRPGKNDTPYRYSVGFCPIIYCYVWFDQDDKMVLMVPEYE